MASRTRSAVLGAGVAAVAILVGVARAGVEGNFSGNVCSLLSAKQVASVVAATTCTPEPKVAAAGITDYHGYWGASPASSTRPYLSFQINTGNAAYLRQSRATLPQTLMIAGTPKKIAGIGSYGYEATGPTRTAIGFQAGKYICTIVVQKAKGRSLSSFNKLAKIVAGKL
jgi:hypothetical protein